MHETNLRRVFLVGCSRSGTTVLQHHLAKHPDVYSLPETDFFGKLLGNPLWATVGRLGRVRRNRVRRAFIKLREIVGDDGIPIPAGSMPRTRECVDVFVAGLDRQARETRKSIWLEKTPKHYRYLATIDHFIPDARIIHMVRDGRDTVASIRDRAQRFPEEFGHQADPAYGVRLWNRAVRTALKRRQAGRDWVIFYEDFVAEPATALGDVCRFLGLQFVPVMLDQREPEVRVTRDDEPWKTDVAAGLRRVESKFDSVFSGEEKRWIDRHLDWTAYNALRQLVHG